MSEVQLTADAAGDNGTSLELGSFVHPVTDSIRSSAVAASDNGTSLELGSFVHPVTDIVSEVQQLRQAITVRPWNLVVLYIQSLIVSEVQRLRQAITVRP